MALITQYGQKCLIFIEVPQLGIADGSGFVKKMKVKIIIRIVLKIMIM